MQRGIENLARRCSRAARNMGQVAVVVVRGDSQEDSVERVSRSGVLIYRDVSGTATPSSVSEEMGDTGWLGERAPVIIETVN